MTTKELLQFYIEIDELKKSIRFKSAPKIRDSSSDHSWKVGLMAIHLAEKLKIENLDINKATMIALIHDLPEYLEGDIDSFLIRTGEASSKQKTETEEKAMKSIAKKYSFGEEIHNIWKEYELKETREAKYISAIDKLETLSHMIAEELITNNGDLGLLHSATYADKSVKNFPELKPLLKEIKENMKIIAKKQGHNWKPEYENFP